MAERRHLYTIPAHRAFADALATGLIRQHGGDPLTLARGMVLLPNNRAKRAVQDAFVRASGGGLLLPRLVAIGDDLDDTIAAALDPAGEAPLPPPVAPLQRRMILARLIDSGDAAEAVRLAGDLARTLDQLLSEDIAPRRLAELDLGDLTVHWQRSLATFAVVLDRWPDELKGRGEIDMAERRSLLLRRLADRWRHQPPPGFVCAAGVLNASPAIAALLAVIAALPNGSVVLPALAVDMPAEEWDALGPHETDPASGRRPRAIETHPQFQLKLLLDRMAVGRGEFEQWPASGGRDAPAAREVAVANALAPAAFTGKWTRLSAEERRLSGVRLAEFATPAEEAQAIALALREVLETEGRTAALVTPDRALARRVAALCARWGIAVDDSAGRPLSRTPPGTLLTGLADAAAQRFAPLQLLALVKHPLVMFGELRRDWLDGARRLDIALRGPRPAPGLAAIASFLRDGLPRDRARRAAALADWQAMQPLFEPLEQMFERGPQPLGSLVAVLRDAAQHLCGDALWAGPAGRAAAALLADLEAAAPAGPALVDPASLKDVLATLMDEVAVRPPQGGHPRLAIYGLIEARLQTADLMILGGLNEGTWPSIGAPDPWLAPRIRAELGLPGPDRQIGLAAHDFLSAMGAPAVLATRAQRDAKGPALASRFWLRLQAMSGDAVKRADDLIAWTDALDDPGEYQPAARPAPAPPAALRPKRISVTQVDRLKADPYAFYAQTVLRLGTLDPVDADPSAAWRGTAVHAVLEAWFREDGCDPAKLRGRALAMLADERTHPMIRALWQPRLMEAIDWLAGVLAEQRDLGRRVLAVERKGMLEFAGVTLSGQFDRIDRLADGGLAIIDYKTGKAPSLSAVRAGFSLQLGLLGAIAEAGGFADINGSAQAFEYWSLAKDGGGFGKISDPTDPKRRDPIPREDFVAFARSTFADAAARWLTGDAPFEAKLHPEYAPYPDYDQLMRLDEWYGREQR